VRVEEGLQEDPLCMLMARLRGVRSDFVLRILRYEDGSEPYLSIAANSDGGGAV
jgi:hypothetical protein